MNIKIGTTKNIAGTEFIILDKVAQGILCLAKNLVYENTQFDSESNNYENSELRKKLNTEFLKKLADEIGEDNIIATEIDLTSDDGLDDYGKVTDKVGLLTADMYRKYNRIIEKYPVDDWWWLSTPWSTPHRGWKYTVRVVNFVGSLDYGDCGYDGGVRPFCIFSPSIFES